MIALFFMSISPEVKQEDTTIKGNDSTLFHVHFSISPEVKQEDTTIKGNDSTLFHVNFS